ncbi:MAG: hypothetical protein ABFR36_00990 [Acidobacteriota bacterium]
MKKKIFIGFFLFSFIFNVVAVVYLLSLRKIENNEKVHTFQLNESQKHKITRESEGILNENIKLENELERCRQDLYNLLNSENNDRAKIEECITTISDIQKKIQLNTVEQLLIYKKHMNKEQCKCFLKEFGENMNVHHKCDENCNCN